MGARRGRWPVASQAPSRRGRLPVAQATVAVTVTALLTASTWGGSAVTLGVQSGAAAVVGERGQPDSEVATVPTSVSSWVSQALTAQAGAAPFGEASSGLFGLSDNKQPIVLDADEEPLGRGGRNQIPASSASVAGIPTAALAAYRNAESILLTVKPSCNLSWSLLAGIGRVESDHGRYGGAVVNRDGRAEPEIMGVPLNGVGPVAAIADSDGGRLDGDTKWDRAVGPLQFIPTTWDVVGSDGDGDDVRDPHDFDDAALAAAVYLCSGGGDLGTRAGAEAAVGRYNHSDEYVALVLAYAGAYENGQLPDDLEVPTPPTDTPALPTVDEPVTQPPVGPPLDTGADDVRPPRGNGGGGASGNGDGNNGPVGSGGSGGGGSGSGGNGPGGSGGGGNGSGGGGNGSGGGGNGSGGGGNGSGGGGNGPGGSGGGGNGPNASPDQPGHDLDNGPSDIPPTGGGTGGGNGGTGGNGPDASPDQPGHDLDNGPSDIPPTGGGNSGGGNTGGGNSDGGNTGGGNTGGGNTGGTGGGGTGDGNTGGTGGGGTGDGNTGGTGGGGGTDDGNTDDGNTDDGNTDDGNTDDGNTDDGNTDDGNTDDGNTDDGNTDDGDGGGEEPTEEPEPEPLSGTLIECEPGSGTWCIVTEQGETLLLPNLADLPLSVDLDGNGHAERIANELVSLAKSGTEPPVAVTAVLATDGSGEVLEVVAIDLA